MNTDRQMQHVSPATTEPAPVMRFDTPQRTLLLENGRLDVITVGRQVVGKGSYGPGWRWSHASQAPPRLVPRHDVVGVEVAGVVRAVGATQARFSPADEVLVHSVPLRHQGAWAEWFLAPGAHVAAKPADLDWAVAGAPPPPAPPPHPGGTRPRVGGGGRRPLPGGGGGAGGRAGSPPAAAGRGPRRQPRGVGAGACPPSRKSPRPAPRPDHRLPSRGGSSLRCPAHPDPAAADAGPAHPRILARARLDGLRSQRG